MISPFLFILYVNELMNTLNEFHNPGLYIDETLSFDLLMYAVDIALVNDTIGRLQKKVLILLAHFVIGMVLTSTGYCPKPM